MNNPWRTQSLMNHRDFRSGKMALRWETVICIVLLSVIIWKWRSTMVSSGLLPLPPSISQIQALSELTTTRVQISDFIFGENNHYAGKWALYGEVLLGVDLSSVEYLDVNHELRKLTLRLPHPHVIATKIDHERSQELSMSKKGWYGPFRSSPQILRDEVWRQADRKLMRLAAEPGYHERAKVQAERVLTEFCENLGWKVAFAWCASPEGLVATR